MNQVTAPIKKLLVIDSQVNNWQSLAAGVGTDTAVLILDSGSDGLTQTSDYLTNLAASTPDFTPLQSLQIMSHGSAGSLLLGSSTLTTGCLKQYTSQLVSIFLHGVAGIDTLYKYLPLNKANEWAESLKAAWTKSCCSQVQHLLNEVCM